MPTYSWGDGRGLLGAEVGTGYLHRLPATSRNTSGSSIERRVRYVNANDELAEKDNQILEMEPQLEMEPDEVEDEPAKATLSISEGTTIPAKPAPVPEHTVVESCEVATPPAKYISNFPPPPIPSTIPTEPSKPALSHTTSSGSTGPPTKPTRQISMQPAATPMSLGPPPQIYHGRQAYTDPKSATTGYKRPSYIMQPSPTVLPQSR